MIGGAGNDIYFVDNAGDVVIENASEGTDTVFSTSALRADGERGKPGAARQRRPAGLRQRLATRSTATPATTCWTAAPAATSWSGGAGNDTYFVDNAGDVVVENAKRGQRHRLSHRQLPAGGEYRDLGAAGQRRPAGLRQRPANTLFGNSGNNLLDGAAGADTMIGGAGNDTYFVDNAGDVVIENAGEGTDTVFATVNYTLTANVETLVLQGSGNLTGTGNALANSLFGNAGDNALDGGAGADVSPAMPATTPSCSTSGRATATRSWTSPATARRRGFACSSSAYGAGATFTNIDATHWEVNYNGGASHDHHVPERRGDRPHRLPVRVSVEFRSDH